MSDEGLRAEEELVDDEFRVEAVESESLGFKVVGDEKVKGLGSSTCGSE